MTNNRIETPSIGEILQEEFMIPMGLSAYKLAQDIKVPVSRIQDILHGRRNEYYGPFCSSKPELEQHHSG